MSVNLKTKPQELSNLWNREQDENRMNRCAATGGDSIGGLTGIYVIRVAEGEEREWDRKSI